MKPSEAVDVLKTAAAFDRRTVGRTDAVAWADALDEIRVDDAIAAVKHHYATSREFIYPADVTGIVKAIRNERIRAAGDISDRIPAAIEAMDDGPEHDAAYQAWLKDAKRRIGNGEPVDDVAPRLQLVQADAAKVKAITEGLAAKLRAPGVKPREEEPA